MLVRWKLRPAGDDPPEFVDGWGKRFTVEMHYNGVLTKTEYQYGSVAHFDGIDPDYFSMSGLNQMVEMLEVDWQFFQFMWTLPGKEIEDGLTPLEGEADILKLTELLPADVFVVKVYLKQLTEFGAWKRMQEIKRDLFYSGIPGGKGGVILEEEVEVNEGASSCLVGSSVMDGRGLGILCLEYPVQDNEDGDVEPLGDKEHRADVGPDGDKDNTADVFTDVDADVVSEVAPECGPAAIEKSMEDPVINVGGADGPNGPLINECAVEGEKEGPSNIHVGAEGNTKVHLNKSATPSTSTGKTNEQIWDELIAEMEAEREVSDSSDDESHGSEGGYEVGSDGCSEDLDDESDDEDFYADERELEDDDDTSVDSEDISEVNRDGHNGNSAEFVLPAEGAEVQQDYVDMPSDEDILVRQTGWGSEAELTPGPLKWPKFNVARDLDDAEIVIGREFGGFGEFKQFCRRNAIKQRRGVRFTVNDKIRCRCECMQGCGFFLYARIRGDSDTVQLVSGCEVHTCCVEEDIRAANTTFLANHYLGRFRVDPNWNARNFQHTVITDFGLKINLLKVYRTKKEAEKLIHGEESAQFTKLRDYKGELERTNPGSTVEIEYDGLTFQRIYICLDAMKRGFKAGCRKFVGVDGCFLKCITGWQLLQAVGVDGNDGMFPIAWAIVEHESTNSWDWFMGLLARDLDITNVPGWTFMSDRQKGLMNVLEGRFPAGEHRYCVRHMYNNFSGKYTRSQALFYLFMDACKATYKAAFDDAMKVLEVEGAKYTGEDGETPIQWMSKRSHPTWCKYYYDTTATCEFSLNNHCESFNNWISDARQMPIISCLESIRIKMMRRVDECRALVASLSDDQICPRPMKKIQKRKEKTAWCFPIFNGLKTFVVNLRAHTCSCGLWQLSGLPCEHALSCMTYNRDQLGHYVHECYRVGTYKLAYQYPIHPLNDVSQWVPNGGPKLRAPTLPEPTPGPKQKKRRLEEGETVTKKDKRGRTYSTVPRTGQVQHCSNCKQTGHNKRHCGKGQNGGSGGASSSTVRKARATSPRAARATSPRAASPSVAALFMPTPGTRVTWNKMRVSRGGRT